MNQTYKLVRVPLRDENGNQVLDFHKDALGLVVPGSAKDVPQFTYEGNLGVEGAVRGGERVFNCPLCGYSYYESDMVEVDGIFYSIEYGCARDASSEDQPALLKGMEVPSAFRRYGN